MKIWKLQEEEITKMFTNFFYALKDAGLKVTLSEWLTLQEALSKGMCNSSLTEFYYLARMILVKSETEFDKFDMVFESCFKAASMETEVSKNLLKWLDKPDMNELLQETEKHKLNQMEKANVDKDDVEEKFKQRLKDQDSEHNGGT